MDAMRKRPRPGLRVIVAAVLLAGGNPLAADHLTYIQSPPHPEPAVWAWAYTSPDFSFSHLQYFIRPGFTPAMIDRIHDAAPQVSWPNTWAWMEMTETFIEAPGMIHIEFAAIDGPGGKISDNVLTFLGHPPLTPPDDFAWHEITDAVITLDSAEAWFTGTGPVPGGQFDFWSRVLHELGHAVGMGTADPATEPGSIMIEGLPTGVARRTLTDDDVYTLQALYGHPEPSTWALFGIGLGVVGYARRRRRGGRPSASQEKELK